VHRQTLLRCEEQLLQQLSMFGKEEPLGMVQLQLLRAKVNKKI